MSKIDSFKFMVLLVSTASVIHAPIFAYADSSSESVAPLVGSTKSESVEILTNKKYQVSQKLTDAKLRADDGSLSQYSLNSTLGYNGPTLGDFSTADQPNPDHKIGVYAQKASGNIMGKYRLDSDHSVAAGTGVSFNHPLSGWDRTDVNNPFVRYDIASRFGELQMRNSPELIYSTIPNYTAVGEVGGFEWYNAMIYNLGSSRFAVGLETTFYYWAFTRSYLISDGAVQSWSLSTAPTVKYKFTDRLNANAGITFSGWNPRQTGDASVFLNYTPTGSLGVGYAYNRDIYFSPYLGFFPGRMSLNSTTLNFTTVFSIL